ncbi:hypothetical protein [uncultured Rhodoblastus sp.]|uniref:hypothetical protein n=1 Tax=uncultured Rhodoblastus sp. TaxID=543037 RepID=UPI0025D614C3|nr:hypothetical protein [uncultured Rhodoblastus sp.]
MSDLEREHRHEYPISIARRRYSTVAEKSSGGNNIFLSRVLMAIGGARSGQARSSPKDRPTGSGPLGQGADKIFPAAKCRRNSWFRCFSVEVAPSNLIAPPWLSHLMGIVVAVVAMTAVMMALRSAHDAFDAADNAAGHSTDHAANRCANRTGGAPTFGSASLTTPDNSLSLSGERHRKSDKNAKKACGYGQPVFHG